MTYIPSYNLVCTIMYNNFNYTTVCMKNYYGLFCSGTNRYSGLLLMCEFKFSPGLNWDVPS